MSVRQSEDLEATAASYTAPGYEGALEELANKPDLAVVQDDSDTLVYQAEWRDELLILRKPGEQLYARDPVDVFHQRIQALRLGLGVLGLEQMISYSVPEHTIITKHAGTPIDELASATARTIPKRHWQTALHAVEQATSLGLCFDTGVPDNLVYDERFGFTFIDYELAENQTEEELEANEEFIAVLETLEEIDDKDGPGLDFGWRKAGQLAVNVLIERYPIIDPNSDYAGMIKSVDSLFEIKRERWHLLQRPKSKA